MVCFDYVFGYGGNGDGDILNVLFVFLCGYDDFVEVCFFGVVGCVLCECWLNFCSVGNLCVVS